MSAEASRAEIALIDALYQQAQPAKIAVGGALGALLFASVQWSLHPTTVVLAWFGVQLAVFAGAALSDTFYRRRAKTDDHVLAWGRRFTFSFLTSSAVWGAAVGLFFDAKDPLGIAFLMVFFAGLGVVCVVAFSANERAFVGYTLFTSVPLAAALFFAGTPTLRLMGLGQVLYLGLTLMAAHELRRILKQAATLRFHNEDMAARLRVEKDRAEQASLSKTRFLAAASHDLRQPLHALSLFVELLDARVTDPEARTFIERIHTSSHALEGLLNSLLDLSRIDSDALQVRRSHLPLAALFDQLEAEFLERAERKGLTLTVRPCGGLVIDSDFELLGRVLRNLLSNALRYSSSGTVVLEARALGARRVALSVADEGRGVGPADQPRVFDEFFRAGPAGENVEGGMGLGLSIVRGICGALGHPVTLRSQPERARGTELIVEVPEGDPALAVGPVQGVPTPPGVLTGRLVLVLDDEQAIRAGMAELLESWSCEPLCAGSLEEASALLAQAGRTPDAVVCDYRLSPEVTGTQVLEVLEARLGGGLRVVMVTGDTSPERVREFKGTGRTLLFKPVMPGKLRAALTALLMPEP